MYIQLNSSGRLIACSVDSIFPPGEVAVDALPDGLMQENISDWVYRDGQWDFQPQEHLTDGITLQERLDQAEMALMELAAMIGGIR